MHLGGAAYGFNTTIYRTYKMKWTFYDAAGRLAAEKLQLALQNAGIRAIVTSRAKNPARLRTKVQRRNSRREEPYQTIEEIYDDIADLSGVRVSLYFPGDRGKVDAIISELFNILEFKQFPGTVETPDLPQTVFRLLGEPLPRADAR